MTPEHLERLTGALGPSEYAAELALERYRHWYNRGWRYALTPTATLEHGDNINAPGAWYDGYLDQAAGRDKWHLATCAGCPEHPDRRPPVTR
jgi:hypothetical protein